ncbi:small conductance mechanosensitive channel [Pedobacter sp. UYEF25]
MINTILSTLFSNTLLKSIEVSYKNFVAQLPDILLGILVIAVGIFLSKKLSQLFRKTIRNKTEDPIMTNFLSKTIKIILIVIVVLFGLKVAGLDGISTALVTAAGASAVIIGFAFKDIGENFLAGIILSFNRPFHINDTIKSGEIFGKVKSMEFRYTKVKTFDGRDVYIPNSDVLKLPLFNYTEDGLFRWDFVVGIAYEDNIDAAHDLILATVNSTEGVYQDEDHETYATVDELSVSTVNIKIFFWVSTKEFRKDAVKKRGEVITTVKNALEQNGYSLPADIQEIKLYGSQKAIPVSIMKGNVEVQPSK